ncbi:DUF1697 domain-containing protein [Microbacterium aurantiacum]|uniref:DUF1697 domain-containing protein n=1 Tax=Microbacterium aurantiacum TaxID=162393 RepID=UPI00260DE8A7|nr:DUF1697 domain-containing protein [Microbacterium aurantiacum]
MKPERFVAFLRNVNQGQRGQPTTDDIRGAFDDAGCRDIRTFQSNGTVLFDADDPASVVQVAEVAVAVRSGHAREIFWIPLARLAEIAEIPHADTPGLYEVTLHDGGTITADSGEIADQAGRRRCALVASGDGWALVRNDVAQQGNATPLIETLTGGRASSRGLPTVIRLIDRFAR